MSHELEIRDGQASFFCVKEPAWHGLGTVVDGAVTAEEAIRLARLDWEVKFHPYSYQFNGETKIDTPYGAIVRQDTGDCLGTVSKTYIPLQNKSAFSFFDALISEHEAVYHSAGVLFGGKKTWISAKMPQGMVIGSDDLIDNYIVIFNSHDGSMSVTAMMTPIRVVCNNTLTAALKSAKNKVQIRHVQNAETKLKEAHKVLGLYNAYRMELESALNQLATKSVSSVLCEQFLSNVFNVYDVHGELTEVSKKNKEMVMNIFESSVGGQDSKTCRGTAYGLYNAVTFFTDNAVEYKSDNSKANSIWFGKASTTREKAFEMALAL